LKNYFLFLKIYVMLKKSFLYTILFFNADLMAQNEAQLDKITQYTCDCINKKDMKNIHRDSLDVTLAVSIDVALRLYIPDSERGLIDFTNVEKKDQLWASISKKMEGKCPKVLKKITQMGLPINEPPPPSNEKMRIGND
jgi:hypothetical protein